MIYSDLELSQTLERTEGRANADFVETRGRLDPASGATWIEVGGAYAMFDGVGSPLTQTFGLGIFEDATDEHLDEIEVFFRDRNADVFHEVSPIAGESMLRLLGGRGYRPVELSTVLYQAVGERGGSEPHPEINTRIVGPEEADTWAAIAAKGWSQEAPELEEYIRGMGRISAKTAGACSFIAEIDGQPVATGGFCVYDDVCILAGASTVPEFRKRGAQNALLAARLGHAASLGCRLAMMVAAPGSRSQKNAQKNGFQIAYTRTKWQLF